MKNFIIRLAVGDTLDKKVIKEMEKEWDGVSHKRKKKKNI